MAISIGATGYIQLCLGGDELGQGWEVALATLLRETAKGDEEEVQALMNHWKNSAQTLTPPPSMRIALLALLVMLDSTLIAMEKDRDALIAQFGGLEGVKRFLQQPGAVS